MQRIENIEEIRICEDIDFINIGIKRTDEEDEIVTIYKYIYPETDEKIRAMREFLRVFNLLDKVKFI